MSSTEAASTQPSEVVAEPVEDFSVTPAALAVLQNCIKIHSHGIFAQYWFYEPTEDELVAMVADSQGERLVSNLN